MTDIQVFDNPEFGQVRIIEQNGEPWFAGKDVASVLGYSNPRDALSKHVDDEDRGVAKCDTLGGTQEVVVINESGLYSLILSSKMPKAKEFKRWVTSEVLPSIRKNGGYIANQENLSDADLMAKALLVAQRTIEERNQLIAHQKIKIELDAPKVAYFDMVETSQSALLIGTVANQLKQKGHDVGEKRLYKWLRERRYLCSSPSKKNAPTQKSLDKGLFIRQQNTISVNGKTKVTFTTKLTTKGQQYIIDAYIKEQQTKEPVLFQEDDYEELNRL